MRVGTMRRRAKLASRFPPVLNRCVPSVGLAAPVGSGLAPAMAANELRFLMRVEFSPAA